MLDGFEGGVSSSTWARVDGRGRGLGCGTLRPEAFGKNLYFSGCGARQAVSGELDLSRVGCVIARKPRYTSNTVTRSCKLRCTLPPSST